MERRPGMDTSCAVPAPPGRPVSAALALALALTLGAGEAAAQQPHCEGTAVTGRTSAIVCDRGASDPNPANVHIIARNPDITTTGFNAGPIISDVRRAGIDVTIEVTGGSLTATGEWAKGIRVWHPGATGDIAITLQNVDVTTTELQGGAVYVFRQGGAGTIGIDVTGGSITTTGPTTSQGILALSTGSGDIDIDTRDVVIKTAADNGLAIYGVRTGATGDVDVAVRGGTIETTGFLAHGVMAATVGGTGAVDVRVADASIVTRERFTRAIAGATSGQGDITVDVSGGTVATSEGEGGVGVYAVHSGDGSSETMVGAGTRIRVPFANGVHGRMTSTANAAGRVVITSGGAIEARDAGILAWVEPRSGSTFGDGESAAGAARTAPMIHVTSSGDVTVGASVMDAWIRAAVAGNDETLSAGEKAVLDTIVAGDETALETALGALPAAYTDDWKARMRAFRSARGAKRTDRHGISGRAPATAAREAEAAAVEILDLPRAGIRAMALSHVEIADHVRVGDVDPAITAIAEASRTTEQKATLATQQMLSAAERTVLEAVLTGGALETALAALPATYTDAWKDGVRQRALAYNDGDIRVDVTGGTIVSEGDGVHARYVLTHDRNGAIAVTVAEGATVSGERNGLYVGGAGLVEGNGALRDQTVTVNGAVTGGTGAGVHLAGGGTLRVGRTGSIGATSGIGVFADGAGDFHATVVGTVEGDVRGAGSGEHTVTVMEGGTVTGTVRLAASTVTVGGTVGRVWFDNGGTVTLHPSGRIEEVDGISILSESGELVVVIVDPGETGSGALPRIEGRIVETGGTPQVLFQSSGSTQRMELLAGSPAPSGAWDVGVVQEGSDGSRLRVEREYGPRTRVYEALPSVLLGLNGLARFEERMAAARTERGGWARVEASRGEWEADASTTGVEYNHRRSGLRAGLDVAAGEKGVLGVSVHHRLGSADVSRGGGLKLTGSGAGVSGTWLGDDAYVDVQAEVTWYEADASSMSRGTLKKKASGRGHALGVEFGRRVSMPALAEGVVFTPRAGLVHSRVSVDDFTDALGTRVTVDEARSLKGRVGVLLEAEPGGSPNRVSGSVDVEHEFSGDMKVRASGVELSPEAEATWVRVGLNGRHAWDDGRYTLRGGVSYARSGSGDSYEVGGGLSLEVRF